MRIIKTFLTSLLILVIAASLSFLAAREVLLIATTTQVKQSLKWIRDIDNQQRYAAECSSKGASKLPSGQIHFTQLRFTQPDKYVIEVICNGMDHNPIELSEEKLPAFITHQVGQSGVRWGTNTALNFEGLNRDASVSIVEGVINTSLKQSEIDALPGPPSKCEAYGYECCNPNSQQGRSDRIKSAIDCPDSCYRFCRPRPLVLNFNTQPYYDKLTRQLTISSGQPVIFSFTVSPNQEPILSGYYDETDRVERIISVVDSIFSRKSSDEEVTVILDYGDGQQDEFESFRGQVEHVYHCSQPSCEYQAQLKVVKQSGVVSVDSLQNKIKIKVN